MDAGARREADWDRVAWTRVPLWILTGVSTLGVAIGLANGDQPLWSVAGGIVVAVAAALAARWISRRDDRGWWLALFVVGVIVVWGVAYAIVKSAPAGIFGNWLAIATLISLRDPPPFPKWFRAPERARPGRA